MSGTRFVVARERLGDLAFELRGRLRRGLTSLGGLELVMRTLGGSVELCVWSTGVLGGDRGSRSAIVSSAELLKPVGLDLGWTLRLLRVTQ
jgi:hypothetical protein